MGSLQNYKETQGSNPPPRWRFLSGNAPCAAEAKALGVTNSKGNKNVEVLCEAAHSKGVAYRSGDYVARGSDVLVNSFLINLGRAGRWSQPGGQGID